MPIITLATAGVVASAVVYGRLKKSRRHENEQEAKEDVYSSGKDNCRNAVWESDNRKFDAFDVLESLAIDNPLGQFRVSHKEGEQGGASLFYQRKEVNITVEITKENRLCCIVQINGQNGLLFRYDLDWEEEMECKVFDHLSSLRPYQESIQVINRFLERLVYYSHGLLSDGWAIYKTSESSITDGNQKMLAGKEEAVFSDSLAGIQEQLEKVGWSQDLKFAVERVFSRLCEINRQLESTNRALNVEQQHFYDKLTTCDLSELLESVKNVGKGRAGIYEREVIVALMQMEKKAEELLVNLESEDVQSLRKKLYVIHERYSN